ncbi:phosphate signaling complex protein PhoU [Ruminococcus sp. NSJ-71]|jgi:phosphate transport system protein|uniref:Phosphate-specific transport system accessory protein PhoU n=1 Tax=Ruminococcus intestinalis TaxID=2763066 RepID=A0ABR7HNG6_9FIRM|nr:phosphate signaling complex protein PhoU [Ruminococcus intestinalis]MBC5729050.1 phosphate signaling complex protein PhoU [Ruminococcus intestinalis]
MREYFDLELKALNDKLIEMGALVEGAIKNTITIITNGEYDKLETSRMIEEKINKMEREIQNYCLNLLLLQSPVAGDLRTVSAALKMITDLERIGDQAIDIAEMSTYLKDCENIYSMTHLSEMAERSSNMVTTAIDAFVKKDLKLAKTVATMDDAIDDLFNKVKQEVIDIINANKELDQQAIDVLLIAKYFEKIGDHAENIGEWVVFSITGKTV